MIPKSFATKEEFVTAVRAQTKALAARIIFLCRELPPTEEARVVGRQLLRSATSVGANYRAVCRARFKAEFFAKVSVTLEEADETQLWLELIAETNILPAPRLQSLLEDYGQIVAILTTARAST